MAGNKNSGRKPILGDGKVIYLRIPGVLLNRIESERKKESFPRTLSNMILALASEALDARDNEALFISKLNTISPNGYNKQRSSIPNKSDGPTVVAARVPFWLLEKVEAERNKESYPRKLPHMFLELVSEALDARDASN